MQSYVLMIQTDPDDRYITESALTEIGASIPVKFINAISELGATISIIGEWNSASGRRLVDLDCERHARLRTSHSPGNRVGLVECASRCDSRRGKQAGHLGPSHYPVERSI